ncbi:hypothetical protein [Maricaulis sp. CAU 1757]
MRLISFLFHGHSAFRTRVSRHGGAGLALLLLLAGLVWPASALAQRVATISPDGVIRVLENVDCGGSDCRWIEIDRNPGSVQLAGTATGLFQMRRDGSIWEWGGAPCEAGRCTSWTRLDGNPQTRAIVGNDRDLFQRHAGGAIYRWTGGACGPQGCRSWERLDANPATRQIVAAGSQLFQRHETGAIYRWTGEPCAGAQCRSWERLDANPQTVEIEAAGAAGLYQRHRGGAIYRWDGRPCNASACPHWTRIDGNPRSVELTAVAGDLYQRHEGGAIWRWLGRPCDGGSCPHWERLDANPGTRQLVAGVRPVADEFSTTPTAGPLPVFQMRADGRVWRWSGGSCPRSPCSNWQSLGGQAFSSFNPDRSRIYVFPGRMTLPSARSATTLTAEDFGFDRLQVARVGDRRVDINILLLMTDYNDTFFDDDQTEAFYREKYFGARQSLQAYFQDNAPDLDIRVNLVELVRYSDPRSNACAHRWTGATARNGLTESMCPGGHDGAAFTMGTVEQLEQLPPALVTRLSRYDRNGDGILTNDELFVINLQAGPPPIEGYPYGDNGGLRRSLPRCAELQGMELEICGGYLPLGDEANLLTTAHEVAHILGGGDIYGASFNNNFGYSLHGSTIANSEIYFHMDPWHKMVMGFARPRVIALPERQAPQNLRLTMPSNTRDYEAVLMYDPDRGRNAFFMLEYRVRQGSSFDRDVGSTGLVIWYVQVGADGNPVNLQAINPAFPEGAAVAIIGAPNQTITQGRAWTAADGEIALNWPGGGDSGLRLRVQPGAPSSPFLTVNWWTE